MLHNRFSWLPYFSSFTDFAPQIPKLYWDVKSHEQRYLLLCENLNKIICYLDRLCEKINFDHEKIDELADLFQQFIDGHFDQYYIDKIDRWIDQNMEKLISKAITQVYFGLTDSGHFCAYIPRSWSDITFDTGAVFGRSDYGRLILRFTADHSIDNTYSYSLSQPTKVDQLIADLEVETKRTDACFDELFN